MHRKYSLQPWASLQVQMHLSGLVHPTSTSICSGREVQATKNGCNSAGSCILIANNMLRKLLYLYASKQVLLEIITVLLVLEDGHNSLCEGSWVECDCDVPLASLDLHAAAKAEQP